MGPRTLVEICFPDMHALIHHSPGHWERAEENTKENEGDGEKWRVE